jgi:hypothetical protein
MLVLVGTLRAATTLPGGTNKKTGEIIKSRDVLQIETLDGRGLVAMNTITVPSLEKSNCQCVHGLLAQRSIFHMKTQLLQHESDPAPDALCAPSQGCSHAG